MGEVIKLFEDDEYLAVCPICEYEVWEIIVDSPVNVRTIKGFRCGQCEFEVVADIEVKSFEGKR